MAERPSASEPVSPEEGHPASDALPRRLGFFELFGGGAAFIAPAFSLSAIFVLLAWEGGSWAPVGIVLGTLAALLTAVSFANLSVRHPKAGGAYALVEREFSLPVGFLAGWSLSILYLLGPAIPLALIALTLGSFFPSLFAYVLPLAVAMALGVFLINVVGARPSNRVALSLFALEATILLAVAVLLFLHPSTAPPPAGSGWEVFAAVGNSGAAAVFLFLGFESVTTYAEESRLPRRDVARATLAAIVVASVIYVVSAMAYLHAIPASDWNPANPDTQGSLPVILGMSLGGPGSNLFGMVVLISSFGALIAVENACARAFFAMGRDGVLPRVFAHLTRSAKTPVTSLALSAVVTVGLVAATQEPWNWVSLPLLLVILGELVVLGAIIAYLLVSLAYLRALLRERADTSRTLPLLLPAGSSVLLTVLFLSQVATGPPQMPQILEVLLLWLGLGALLWLGRPLFAKPE